MTRFISLSVPPFEWLQKLIRELSNPNLDQSVSGALLDLLVLDMFSSDILPGDLYKKWTQTISVVQKSTRRPNKKSDKLMHQFCLYIPPQGDFIRSYLAILKPNLSLKTWELLLRHKRPVLSREEKEQWEKYRTDHQERSIQRIRTSVTSPKTLGSSSAKGAKKKRSLKSRLPAS